MFDTPPNLLITDDDQAVRATLRSVFAPRGFNTLMARDGDEALQILQRQSVHVLLTDLHMPRMNGLETIRCIRQRRLILPCILLSAGLDEGLVEEARELKAFSVLRKPVRFSEVTGAVRQAMKITYGWTLDDDPPGAIDAALCRAWFGNRWSGNRQFGLGFSSQKRK